MVRWSKVIGVCAVLLALGGAPAFAQEDCYNCTPQPWIEFPDCELADWDEMGYTHCEAFGYSCNEWGEIENEPHMKDCWGGISLLLSTTKLLASGTQVGADVPLSQSHSVSWGTEAEPVVSAAARLYERSCKGLITGRLFGRDMIAELKRATKVITI